MFSFSQVGVSRHKKNYFRGSYAEEKRLENNWNIEMSGVDFPMPTRPVSCSFIVQSAMVGLIL
jgi:hypothetical protein